MKPTKIVLLASLSLVATTAVAADMFRCVDRSGTTFYSQQPCPGGDRVTPRDPHTNPESPPHVMEEKSRDQGNSNRDDNSDRKREDRKRR
jgi:hypothetical protein